MFLSRIVTIILISNILIISSCNCKKKTNSCPSLSNEYQTFLTYQVGDTITFVNNNGDHTNFVVRNKTISESAEYQCHNGSYGNCICFDCDIQGGYSAVTNDKLWARFDTVDNEEHNYGKLHYAIFELNNNEHDYLELSFAGLEFQFEYPVKPENFSGNQRIISDTNLGSHAYQNVIEFKIDTSSSWGGYKESFYTKLFIKPEIGIIGFHHTKMNSTFYLQ